MYLVEMSLAFGLRQELRDAFSQGAVEYQIRACPINVLCWLTLYGGFFAQSGRHIEVDVSQAV